MIPWKTVSVSTLVAAIPVIIGVNHAYENWHEEFGNARWAQKREFAIAQSEQAKNSAKLDTIVDAVQGIQIQTAISVANDFQQQLDSMLRVPDSQRSVDWVNERDRLVRRVKLAEEHKQCLINEKPNCDLLRGW